MTTPSTARKAGPLLGNGSTTAFPFTFKVFAAADVAVTIANSSGVETPLVLNTDYSVTLNGNQDTSPGGTITYPISGAALPSGSKLSIVGDLDYDQPLDLPSGGNFSPTALENQLDRATMQIQQLAEGLSRAAKLPVTNSEDPETLVADIVRLADSADNIDTAVANIAAINTVASDLNEPVSEINTVAGAITNVNTVGNNISSVNTVAGISANVTTVAGISSNVTAVASISSDVSTVAAISGDVAAVENIAANVTTVAGIAANVTTVAGIAANVTTVAGNNANVTTVGSNMAAVTSNAANMGAIQNASANAVAVQGALAQVNNGTKQRFVAGVGYTKNTTTQLTLTSTPAKPGFVQVFFDGVYQNSDKFTLADAVITFTSAIPADTVEVAYDVPVMLTEDATWRLADARLREGFRKEKATPIAPTLLLDFSGDKQLDPRITFTRASTATYYDQFGVLKTAAANVSRFDHNPATGESLGLMIGEQRTNLLTYSEQFDNAVWVNSNATVAANTVVAPDGTVTADKIIPASGAVGSFYRPTGVNSSQTVTLSFYAKAAEWRYVRLQFGISFSPQPAAWFDLQTGVIVSQTGTGAQISSVGNGWFRISVTATWLSSSDANLYVNPSNLPSSHTLGDGTSGIYFWGSQLEAGAFATSYIPTVASQVTRAADSASMTAANFTSWYRQDAGTFYVDVLATGVVSGKFPNVYAASDGTNNNSIRLLLDAQFSSSLFTAVVGGTNQTTLNMGAPTNSTPYKFASAYRLDNFASSRNGATALTDTSGTTPVVDRLHIGRDGQSVIGNPITGTIKKLAYYPLRLTDAQLQALTT